LLREVFVEFRLNAANRVKNAILGAIDIVKMRATIQPVLPLLGVPEIGLSQLEYALTEVNQVILGHILDQLGRLPQIKQDFSHCHQRMHIVEHQVVGGLLG